MLCSFPAVLGQEQLDVPWQLWLRLSQGREQGDSAGFCYVLHLVYTELQNRACLYTSVNAKPK